jgi:hypothetical protein
MVIVSVLANSSATFLARSRAGSAYVRATPSRKYFSAAQTKIADEKSRTA